MRWTWRVAPQPSACESQNDKMDQLTVSNSLRERYLCAPSLFKSSACRYMTVPTFRCPNTVMSEDVLSNPHKIDSQSRFKYCSSLNRKAALDEMHGRHWNNSYVRVERFNALLWHGHTSGPSSIDNLSTLSEPWERANSKLPHLIPEFFRYPCCKAWR